MPTFLHYLFVRTLSIKSSRVFALLALLLCTLGTSLNAQTATPVDSLSLTTPVAVSSSSRPERKRLVTFRRNETTEGSRLTLTSDTPLGDYRSFAEGERVCIMIPQAAFASQRRDESGRGFADMRVEQRDEAVMLSFRLQQGASVAVRHNFNRLEVVFMTNERANSDKSR